MPRAENHPFLMRRQPVLTAALATAVPFVFASCRTTVRVVDEAGSPVRDASVSLEWPSFHGEVSVTDADGYALLHDAWTLSGAPSWVHVRVTGRLWQVDYPPPSVIRLVPAEALPASSANLLPSPAGNVPSRRR
jgi:hypothetical protein